MIYENSEPGSEISRKNADPTATPATIRDPVGTRCPPKRLAIRIDALIVPKPTDATRVLNPIIGLLLIGYNAYSLLG